MKEILLVSGVARSGTSALVYVLNKSPDIVVGMERYFHLIRQERLLPGHFSVGRFGDIRPDDSHKPASELAAAPAALAAARYLGDKYPLLYKHFAYVFEALPQARHVYILRNPLSVVESYDARERRADDPWHKDWRRGLQDWNESVRAVAALAPAQRARIHLLQYETFFSAPAQMKALFAALGVAPPGGEALAPFAEKFARLNTQEVPRRDDIRTHVARHADWSAYGQLLAEIDRRTKTPPQGRQTAPAAAMRQP